MNPKVSVIMPVFNAEKYISAAIDSILNQSFQDFEFIIIDDGSTDSTASIVKKITSSRISFYQNESNTGLAGTLNRGISLSTGIYTARMDGDDISRPDRFEKQVKILDERPDVVLVDSIMEYIDARGNSLGKYNSTKITMEQMKDALPKENCMGHSSIMIRKNILDKYGYKQVGNEDYDLWLRLISDNYLFFKINEPLLLYRIHEVSYTQTAVNTGRHFFRIASTKRKYLAEQFFKRNQFSAFNMRVFCFMLKDYATAIYKMVKIRLRNLFLQ